MTRIEETHEQLLAYRKVTPLGQRAVALWVETHEGIEQEISHLKAETLDDVLIKLDVGAVSLMRTSLQTARRRGYQAAS